MANGYMDKILRVDLSTGDIRDQTLDDKTKRLFLGGYGVAAHIIFSEQPAGADPLGPDSILAFMSGPLTGTPAVSGTRFTVAGKSPLTGTWGDANAGGYFSAYLKFAGYDGILVKGIAKKPVYLFVDNGKAEIRDASHLWGKDTYETEDILKRELGNDVAIATIGPAGEKRSLIAGVVHAKGSVAARSGLGAVMGAKRLKAVVVRGKMEVPVAKPEEVKKLRSAILAKLGGEIEEMRRFGTTFVTLRCAESGDAPIKNYGGVVTRDMPELEPLSGEAVEQHKMKRIACYHCPVGCEALLKEGRGEYKYEAGTFRPEYETLAMLGTNCLNNNLESIIKANDICNRYGMDTISAGSIIAFAMECYENGIITKEDTGGIELNWGNHKALVDMVEKIGRREGFGDVLADGVRLAAQRIGKGAEEYAMHIHGQEVPGHNPSASPNVTVTYLTDATPGRHTQGSEEHHSAGLLPEFDRQSYAGRGKAHRIGSNFQHSLMCCGVCLFVNMTYPDAHSIAQFMSAVTGWDITTSELVKTGERIATLRQAFNVREGADLRGYSLPGRLAGKPPQNEGPLAGVTVDNDTMVKEYLAEMDWDPVTGKPSKKKLMELGLDDVAKALYP